MHLKLFLVFLIYCHQCRSEENEFKFYFPNIKTDTFSVTNIDGKRLEIRINKAFHKIMNKFPVPITPVYLTTPKPRAQPKDVQLCADTLKSCAG